MATKVKAKGKIAQKVDPVFKQIVKELCAEDCEICHGIGYVRYDLPVGHPKFGRIEPCPNRDMMSFEIFASCGLLPAGIYDEPLEVQQRMYVAERKLAWDALLETDSALEAREAIEAVIERGHGWLYLWGSTGIAKTLALHIAVKTMLEKKTSATYVSMARIIDDLRSAFDKENASEVSEIKLSRWISTPLLAIDEFDRVRGTEFAEERKFVLMDERYQRALRGQSITIMASNENPELLDAYLSSRIHDARFKVLHLEGADMRLAAQQESLL